MLTDKEKNYLTNVLEPFMDKVKSVKKNEGHKFSYLSIELIDETFQLPMFENGQYYNGMEDGEEYTLLQLSIIERR